MKVRPILRTASPFRCQETVGRGAPETMHSKTTLCAKLALCCVTILSSIKGAIGGQFVSFLSAAVVLLSGQHPHCVSLHGSGLGVVMAIVDNSTARQARPRLQLNGQHFLSEGQSASYSHASEQVSLVSTRGGHCPGFVTAIQ